MVIKLIKHFYTFRKNTFRKSVAKTLLGKVWQNGYTPLYLLRK